jgi:small subunit ribosomal protein S4e
MVKRHLKRLRSPSFWKLSKKETKWAIKPAAGPHKLFESIPLSIILRDILNFADTAKESRSILKMRDVLVDGKPRDDPKYPVGLMDIVVIPKLKKHYRMVPTQKGMELIEISAEEAKRKLYRIRDKTLVRGGKSQLNLHDGVNMLVDTKDAKAYSAGDSIVVEVKANSEKKIVDHYKLEKGAFAVIQKGKNAGMSGRVEEMVMSKTKEPTKVMLDVDGKILEVTKDYVLVVGKESAEIKIA